MTTGASSFGLLAALLWGGSDFTGGMGAGATEGGATLAGSLRLILLAHVTSMLALLTGALLLEGPPATLHGAGWALGAGFVVAVSLMLFYKLLSEGQMGVSAAVSGVLAAAIPSAVVFFRQGSPGWMRLTGFACAAIAIWLIGAEPASEDPLHSARARRKVMLAVLCGAGFGIYFLALQQAGAGGVLWPIVTLRIGSSASCALLLLVTGNRLLPRAGSLKLPWKWISWTAVLGTGGDLAFVSATRAGRLDIASVLASLYPASTILLAAWLLKERPTGRQRVGMLIAAGAVVLITL